MPRKGRALTPKRLRDLLKEGKYEFENRRVPKPPEEWRPWKRAALSQCIEAAWLFLKCWSYKEIGAAIGESGVTRQRVAQRVKRGTEFFLQRNWIRPKGKRGTE